jgi:hypothetical protein
MDKIKKIVKRVLMGIGALLVLGIVGMIVKFYVLSPKSRPAPVMTAPTNPEVVLAATSVRFRITPFISAPRTSRRTRRQDLEAGPMARSRERFVRASAKMVVGSSRRCPT